MQKFLQTMKEQFENDCNVIQIVSEEYTDEYLNQETGVLMHVYKDESHSIISLEFTGV